MIKRILMSIVILLSLFFSAGVSLADNVSTLFSFANALFAEKDYYRAITEYKRILVSHRDTQEGRVARFMIGLAYFRGEKWESALTVFQEVERINSDDEFGKSAGLMMGECAYQAGNFASSLDYFQSFARRHPHAPRAIDARMRASQSLLLINENSPALTQALSLASDFPHDDRASTFSREIQASMPLSRKSPAVAGLLSAVFPGAGQLYTRRPRDAGISFLLNGGVIAAAAIAFHKDEPVAGGLLSIVGLTWYTGNIYGAVNATHKYNRSLLQKLIENLDFQCGIMQDAEGDIVPTGGFSFRF